jgi:hypothetical protein
MDQLLMAKKRSYSQQASVKPPQAVKVTGQLGTSLETIGDPYVPRTASEKRAWGKQVKHALGATLHITESMGFSDEEVDHVVDALGFKSLYALSDGRAR